MTPGFWRGRRVLVTGNTGFKGSWLTAWLDHLGAIVSGYALGPEANPNLWDLLGLRTRVPTTLADINDRPAIRAALDQYAPEIVIHMAAQSLVSRSYAEPEDTFATNVGGTVTLLRQIAATPSVRVAIIVTSDKCYELANLDRGFREDDRFGGRDPYSASKGCAEIVAASMRHSYFAPYASGGHPARICTVRAGNVIGGGDWSVDRLVPDVVRGCLGEEGRIVLRMPRAIRPWQHVLEPLRGYLTVAQQLFEGRAGADRGWNFGPRPEDERPVLDVANALCKALGRGQVDSVDSVEGANFPYETSILRLDINAAEAQLGWRPILDFDEAIDMTASWYAKWADGAESLRQTIDQIDNYMQTMQERA